MARLAGVAFISASLVFACTSDDASRITGGASPTYTITTTTTAASLTLSPAAASTTVNTQHCVTATVQDTAANAVDSVTVRFSVVGAHSASDSATTDTTGRAPFCYIGTQPGDDTITAFADTNGSGLQDPGEPSGTATKAWVGTNFACAIAGGLDVPGRVWCWGTNDRGQLGSGDTARSSSVPVAVAGTSDFADLAAGERFTCGLAGIAGLAGPVWCWGANESGQLGNGDTTDSRVPVQIANGGIFHTIGAGPNFACGIAGGEDEPGPVWCWGANESGQLGNGTTTTSSVPVAIASSVNFGDLDVGPRFACALTNLAGPVWCWGANESGQLGNGTTTGSSVPVPTSSSLTFNTLALGDNFVCGIEGRLDRDGPVWCWGANESGQLGNGTTTSSSVPVRIASSQTFSTLVAGPNFICGVVGRVDAAGQVLCWGANESGQLGNGTTTNSSVPVGLSSGLLFGDVAVGPNFACAYQGTGGPAWCWGANQSGQLGNGTTTGSSVPVAVSSGVPFGGLDAGRQFVCGFAGTSGPVWCWGANESGQLGNGTTTNSSVPVPISSSLNYWVIALTP